MSLINIEALTQAQKDAMSIHAQKWIGIGLASGATNRAIIEPIIADFYRRIGKAAPKFIYAQSPVAGLVIANLLKVTSVSDDVMASVSASVRDSVLSGVRESVWSSVWYSLRSSLMASVRASVSDDVSAGVWDSVSDSIWSSVWNSVMDSVSDSVLSSVSDGVWSSVWNSVMDSVRASVMDSVMDSVWSSVRAGELQYHQFLYGSHDVDWLAFYSYFSEYIKDDIYTEDQKRTLQQWIDLNSNCGWWYPFEGVCIVCDRPEYTLVDERGRLHSYSSPAIRYTDGFEIYAVHGVRLSADIINDRNSITPARIMTERNVEVARVMTELYGENKLLENSNAVIIDMNDNPEIGTLYRLEFETDDEPIVKLKVRNSTAEPDGTYKYYWLGVPPNMRTAQEARAWTFEMSGDEFNPVIET